MKNKEFLEYLKDNIKIIYFNFEKVFGVNYEEFFFIIKIIIKDLTYDNFYQNLISEDLIKNFDLVSLTNLLKMFKDLNLDLEEIKKIILVIPEVFLFSQNLNDIHLIYKNDTIKGIAFINQEDYRSYSIPNNALDETTLNNILEFRTINSYDYLIKNLLLNLNRKDIKRSFDLTDNSNLTDKFAALTKIYSKKNYYFKKK